MHPQETTVYTAALIASGILALVLLYFVITIIQQQRKTRALHREKIQAEILTLEKERARIASDLHDDLGPILSAIKFKINAVDLHSEEDKAIIEKASDHIDDALQRIREITFGLMPNTLVRKGLVKTVEEFIPKAQRIVSIFINFHCDSLPQLPPETEVNLYRIIQEVVHNVIKHAKATTLDLSITVKGDRLALAARDNGCGFDFEKTLSSHPGLGLKNLMSRVEVMHGDFRIQTSPGKGVQYLFTIPITQVQTTPL